MNSVTYKAVLLCVTSLHNTVYTLEILYNILLVISRNYYNCAMPYFLQMRSLHMNLFPNTSFNFSCTQRQLSNLCEDLAILVFSESVKTQFQQYEANTIGHHSEENWLERNIGDGVPPQVLQVVTREFQRCRTENSTLICG